MGRYSKIAAANVAIPRPVISSSVKPFLNVLTSAGITDSVLDTSIAPSITVCKLELRSGKSGFDQFIYLENSGQNKKYAS